jgi:ring-1,2-phenylacetyl-CoA epoxidase subunit PaaE
MANASLIKKLTVTQVIRETDSAVSLVLSLPEDWNAVYRSGQFLTLVFATRFGEKRRSYSISSSPELNEPLKITVKRIANGEFSRPLVERTQVGDVFFTSGISGFFTLPEVIGDGQEFCFLAAGSGITPCFSLIRTLLHTTRCNVKLIYSNSNIRSTIFYSQLLELQEAFPQRLHIRFLFSDSGNIYSRRFSRWLSDIILEEFYPRGSTDVLFYICGPFEYMLTAKIAALSKTKAENIRKEDFSYFPRLIMPEPPDTAQHRVTIKMSGNVFAVNVQYPQSILAVAKKQGIGLPYSCEAGRCGSCVATCTQGEIWMAYNEVLVDSEIKKGRILTCQGFPVNGDAVIDIS